MNCTMRPGCAAVGAKFYKTALKLPIRMVFQIPSGLCLEETQTGKGPSRGSLPSFVSFFSRISSHNFVALAGMRR